MGVKGNGLGMDRARKAKAKRIIKGFSLKSFRRFLEICCRWYMHTKGKDILCLTLNADDCGTTEASKRFSRFTDELKYWTNGRVYGIYRKEFQPSTKRRHFHVVLICSNGWEAGERASIERRAKKYWNKLNPGWALSVSERTRFHNSSVLAQHVKSNEGAVAYLLKVGEFEDVEGELEAEASGTVAPEGLKSLFYGKVNAKVYEQKAPPIPMLPKGIEGAVRDDVARLSELLASLQSQIKPQFSKHPRLQIVTTDGPWNGGDASNEEVVEPNSDENEIWDTSWRFDIPCEEAFSPYGSAQDGAECA